MADAKTLGLAGSVMDVAPGTVVRLLDGQVCGVAQLLDHGRCAIVEWFNGNDWHQQSVLAHELTLDLE